MKDNCQDCKTAEPRALMKGMSENYKYSCDRCFDEWVETHDYCVHCTKVIDLVEDKVFRSKSERGLFCSPECQVQFLDQKEKINSYE